MTTDIMYPLELHRYKLIALIMREQDVNLLVKMEEVLEKKINPVDIEAPPPAYMRAVKPLRKGATLEQLIEEADYKPIDRESFFEKVDAIGIEEPIEELLAMLTP